MKRIISILLAIATLLTLTACGKKDSGKVQTSSKGEATIQSPAKETKSEEVEPIENYLVKVELTPENFYDYFEWELVHYPDEWGDMTESLHITLKSKAYDDGLIMYGLPRDVQFEFKRPSSSDFSTHDLVEFFNPNDCAGLGGYSEDADVDDGFNEEEKTCTYGNIHPISCYEIGRVKGTITFVKAEYIDHIEKGDKGWKQVNFEMYETYIYLKNGEMLKRWGIEDFLSY